MKRLTVPVFQLDSRSIGTSLLLLFFFVLLMHVLNQCAVGFFFSRSFPFYVMAVDVVYCEGVLPQALFACLRNSTRNLDPSACDMGFQVPFSIRAYI